jgi:hypothetical protein
MADETTETVEAIQPHSYNGTTYEVGDTYAMAAEYVDSVVAQGKAKRVERPTKPATKPAPKPVAPLTTHDLKTTEIGTRRKTSLATKRKK